MAAAGQYRLSDAVPIAGTGAYSLADAKPVGSGEKELPSVPEQVMTSIQNQAKGLFETIHGAFDPRMAVKQGDEMLGAQIHEWNRAKENYAKGDYLGAVTGALGAAVPLIGPMINRTADKLATPGQRAEGVTDIALPLLLGKVGDVAPVASEAAGAVARGVGSAARSTMEAAGGLLKKPDLVQGAAGAGATLGHMTGIPGAGTVGAVLGGKLAARVARSMEAVKAVEPPALPAETPALPQAEPAAAAPEPAPVATPRPETVTVDPEARWDPSTLPPDPFKQTEAFRRGVEAMRARKAGAPDAPKESLAPAKPAENADLTQRVKDLLRQEKIKAGMDPDQPLGQVKGGRYQEYFDEGSVRTNPKTGKLEHASEIIKSEERKASSTAEPANPARIADDIAKKLAGRITTKRFDSMTEHPEVLRVITRQYGVEPNAALIKMIRSRIAARSSEVTGPTTISIADLMKR